MNLSSFLLKPSKLSTLNTSFGNKFQTSNTCRMNHHFLLLVLNLALQASFDAPIPVQWTHCVPMQKQAESRQSPPTLFPPLLILEIIFVYSHLVSRLKHPSVLSSSRREFVPYLWLVLLLHFTHFARFLILLPLHTCHWLQRKISYRKQEVPK